MTISQETNRGTEKSISVPRSIPGIILAALLERNAVCSSRIFMSAGQITRHFNLPRPVTPISQIEVVETLQELLRHRLVSVTVLEGRRCYQITEHGKCRIIKMAEEALS